MATQVFVISDLHLGGVPGFQMCPPTGRTLLAEFVRSVTAQHRPELEAHLVIAGDVVDFALGPLLIEHATATTTGTGSTTTSSGTCAASCRAERRPGSSIPSPAASSSSR